MGSNRSSDNSQKRKKVGGLQELRTAVKARLRSKPTVEGQEHLDMYALTRDRARWARMARKAERAIEEIEKEMKKLRKAASDSEDTQNHEHVSQPLQERSRKDLGALRADF